MADVNKLIREKIKLYDLDDFMKSVRVIQRDVFKESIDFYIAELNKLEGKSFTEKGSLAATAVNRFEKRITDAIKKNASYQSSIRGYLSDFSTMDKLNLEIHSLENGIKINKIIKAANQSQRELVSKTAKGIVGEISDKSLTNNLTGQGMREQFTKPVKRMIYQNLMTGTPGSELKTQLHDYIVGRKGEIGQLERWSGQITRDALSQYDGAINDMVRKEFGLNAYRYVGSLVKDSRPQCERWVREKGGILMYDELEKEISWAINQGKGMIPGTNKDNFGTYRGGYNCRHSAIPTTIEQTPN